MKLTSAVLIAMSALLCSGQSEKPAPTDETPLIRSIQGPALFGAYCAVCHGTDGKGNGPMAKSLRVKPSDLTGIAMRNGGKFPMARVQRLITEEEQVASGHGTREMPIWGPVFSRVESDLDFGRVRIDNLAKYIEGTQRK